MESQKTSPLTVPVAIVVAGVLIAGAVLFSRGGMGNPTSPTESAAKGPEGIRALFGGGTETTQRPAPDAPVSLAIPNVNAETDHILGNPNAGVVIVEYSDLECPFCRVFHQTLKRLMTDYGKSGTVAWVYRHFPLPQLHSKAQREAEATECAAELGGNTGFWKYTDRIFEITPSNDGLDLALLPEVAAQTGLDRSAFESCLTSGRQAPRVEAEYMQATGAGARGTPFNVLILRQAITDVQRQTLLPLFERYRDPTDGKLPIAFSTDNMRVSLSGAMPYEVMKATIDTLLK
jgi:protein-disulfide isomerase